MADTDTFAVEVPNLDRSYANPQCRISGGHMVFKRYVAFPSNRERDANMPKGMISKHFLTYKLRNYSICSTSNLCASKENIQANK